jgi:hypothetical protein
MEEVLTSEATSGWKAELVEVVQVESKGGAIIVSLGAQRTLVDAREMGLLVEVSFEGVVAPVGTIRASVTATGSRGLVHTLEGSGWGNCSSSSSLRVLIRIF